MQQNRSRRTTIVAVSSMVLGLALQGLSPVDAQTMRKRIGGSPRPVTIAMFPVINDAGMANDLRADDANSLLFRELSSISHFMVKRATAGPATGPGDRVRMAKEAGADWALTVRLTRVGQGAYESPSGQSQPTEAVELYGEAWSTEAQSLVARTYAVGTNRPPARGERKIKGKLYPKYTPLEKAVADTVDQFAEVALMRGIVVSKPEGGFVRISMGSMDHVRNNAEVMFGSVDDVIGYGDVIEVDGGHSMVRVRPRFAYQRIELNTPFQVVYNPPGYAAGMTVAQREARADRVDEFEFGASLVIAILGIFVFKPIIDRNLFP